MNIFWFRRDLRITDNPALYEAIMDDSILPVFILDDRDGHQIGGASKWWLHYSLNSLSDTLNGKLQFFQGNAEQIIPQLAKECGAKGVYWNQSYETDYNKTNEAVTS